MSPFRSLTRCRGVHLRAHLQHKSNAMEHKSMLSRERKCGLGDFLPRCPVLLSLYSVIFDTAHQSAHRRFAVLLIRSESATT